MRFRMPERKIPESLIGYRNVVLFWAREQPGQGSESRDFVRARSAARFLRRNNRLEIESALFGDDDFHATSSGSEKVVCASLVVGALKAFAGDGVESIEHERS